MTTTQRQLAPIRRTPNMLSVHLMTHAAVNKLLGEGSEDAARYWELSDALNSFIHSIPTLYLHREVQRVHLVKSLVSDVLVARLTGDLTLSQVSIAVSAVRDLAYHTPADEYKTETLVLALEAT